MGRLVPYKGLDVLLRAVQGSHLRVVIVGDGPQRTPLAKQIAALGLGDRVTLAGEVPDADLPGYYQAADYVVLPSVSAAEMLGVVLLEAMACGKPVINTALPTGVREVNVPEITGLEVPPADAVALRAAMERLAGDPDFRRRLGAAGRSRVERFFTSEQMVDTHLALCEEVIQAAGARLVRRRPLT